MMKRSIFSVMLIAVFLCSAGALMAQEDTMEPAESSVTAADEGLPEIPADVLEKKKEGWYTTFLPIVTYNSDNGLGYGARVVEYNNGKKDDPYFKNTPYFYQITAQFYQTTLGWQYHFVESDMPYFLGSKFRVITALVYDESKNANYFGIGPEATDKLTDSGGTSYDTYEDYQDDFLTAGGANNYKYDKYTIKRPFFNINTYYNLTNQIKVMARVDVKYTDVTSWQGRKADVKAGDVDESDVTMNATRIDVDGVAGQDGWLNKLTFGIGYDTRDFEPDPRNGYLAEYTLSMSNAVIGSDFDYTRHTLGFRYFITPIKSLTFATRLGYTTTTGDVPFHDLGKFVFLFRERDGLGNSRTLRGYPSGRFIGKTMSVGNLESRWTFAELTPGSQLFAFKLVAFVDTGSAFDDHLDVFKEFDYYHVGYGGGLVIAWNQSFLVHVYSGHSSETSSLSIDVSHAF